MIEFLILVVCIFFSAFFSLTETALTSLSQLKVKHMEERRVPGASLIRKLKEDPAKLLSTILIGNNIANIGSAALATTIVLRWTTAYNWGGEGVAASIATGAMTFLLLVFGEITPKTIAIRHPEAIAPLAAWPIYIIAWVLTPVAWFLTFISAPLLYLFGGRLPQGGPFVTEEEIKFLIAASAQEGVIEKSEKEMISSIFEFGDTTVKEVMTPRPDIKAVEQDATIDEAIDLIKETGHSRIPVYEGNLDNIVGVIYAKELMDCRRGEKLRDFMRAAMFIPDTKRLDDILHQMQASHNHLAVVVDEYGVTAGIVSMEDLVEEIVGEIHDEFEKTERNIYEIDDRTFLIDGKLTIADVNRELSLALPEGEYETLAGFVFNQLGKAPSAGDVVKYDDLQITVDKVQKRRILRVKLMKLPRRIEDNMVGG